MPIVVSKWYAYAKWVLERVEGFPAWTAEACCRFGAMQPAAGHYPQIQRLFGVHDHLPAEWRDVRMKKSFSGSVVKTR